MRSILAVVMLGALLLPACTERPCTSDAPLAAYMHGGSQEILKCKEAENVRQH